MNNKWGVTFCAFAFTLLAATPASALTRDEVKELYYDVLDRAPLGAELNSGVDVNDIEKLRSRLMNRDERNTAIKNLYQRALKRDPRADELETLNKFRAPIGKITEQLFSSDERRQAIVDSYKNLLGREPQDSDLDFYIKTRSPFEKIKDVLSKSNERREIVQRFLVNSGNEFNETQFANLRLNKISELQNSFGTPSELLKKLNEIQDHSSSVSQAPTPSSVAQNLRDEKPELVPCLLNKGESFSPDFGICRMQWIDGNLLEAIAPLAGEDTVMLKALGEKILVLSLHKQTASSAKNDLDKLEDASVEDVKKSFSFKKFDDRIESLKADVKEQLINLRELKLQAIEKRQEAERLVKLYEQKLETAKNVLELRKQELVSTPLDRREFIETQLEKANIDIKRTEVELEEVKLKLTEAISKEKVADENSFQAQLLEDDLNG